MADLQSTIYGLENFSKTLKAVGASWEENLVNNALELLKSQQAEIEKHEHRMTVAELHEKYNSI